MPKQCECLNPCEIVPRACELVFASVLVYVASNVRLFQGYFVRSGDTDADNAPVHIGMNAEHGLVISSANATTRHSQIGLASMWQEEPVA